jgi:tape measure domain-containing protein
MATIRSSIEIQDKFSSTLTKLDSGLNKSNSTFERFNQGLNNAKVPKFGQAINQGLDSVKGKLSETGSMFKSVFSANLISGAVSNGIGAIKNELTGLISDLSESAAVWSTFNGNMTNMGKSKAEIAAVKKDLQGYAQATIYSASDMSSTYAQLAAVGTKNTTQLVKGFGGLAAASEDPAQAMKTLSQQATQMAALPKVQWADFKLMLQQTPAGMSAVAKSMHKSTSQLIKDIQAGKVKTQDFFDAISKTGTNDAFSDMATHYKTMGQAMDGLRETVVNKLGNAFDKFNQKGITAISGITDKISEVNFDSLADKAIAIFGKIQQGWKSFSGGFSDSGAAKSITKMFDQIKTAMGSLDKSTGKKDPFAFLKTLGSGVGSTISGLAKAIGAIATAIGDLDPATLAALGAAIVVLKGGTKGLIVTGIVTLLNVINKMPPATVNSLAKGLTALAIAIAAFKAVSKVASGVSGFLGVIGKLGKTKVSLPLPDGAAAASSATGLLKAAGALLMIAGAVALAAAGMWIMVQAATQLASAGWPAVAALGALIVVIGAFIAVTVLLGPALLAGSAGLIAFGAGLVIIGAAVLIAAAGLALIAVVLPLIAQYGTTAAVGFLAMAGALILFGPAAIVAGAGALVLAVGLAALGVAVMVAAVGVLMLGAGLIVASVGLLLIAVTLPLISMFVTSAATGFVALAGALLLFSPMAILAGASAIVLGAGLLVMSAAVIILTVGLALLSASMMLLGVSTLLVSAGMLLLSATLPIVSMYSMTAAIGLMMMSTSMLMLAPMALMTAASITLLAAGLTLFGVAAIVAGAGAMVLSAGLVVVSVSMLLVAASVGVTAAALSALGAAVMGLATAFIVAGSMLVSAITSAMSGVVSAVSSGIQSAVSAAEGFADSLVSVGSDLIQGFINGVKSMAKNIISSVSGAIGGAVDWIKSKLKIGSPSRLMKQYGRWTMEGYSGGIIDRARAVRQSAGKVIGKVTDAFSSVSLGQLDTSSLLSSNPGDLLAKGFNRAARAVGTVASALVGLPSDSSIGITGDIDGTDGFTTHTPDGLTPGGGTTYSQSQNSSNSDNRFIVEKGAFVFNGNTNPDDAETIVEKIESYLKQKHDASLA